MPDDGETVPTFECSFHHVQVAVEKGERVGCVECIELPPGFKLTHVSPLDKDGRYIEVSGPDQPDAYRDGEFFPGGISLFVPGVDPQLELASAYVTWAFHEALEFVVGEDGRRLANPHPAMESEDEMWTWLRDGVGRLLSDYRDRWPVVDEPTEDDGGVDVRGVLK